MEFFGDDFDGAQAGVMLSHDTPLMAMNNVSTCKITPSLKQSGDTFELELSCQNETAAGKGCITTSQLRKEVVSLVETFFSPTMSENDLSIFLRLHVQPMLEAAPEVMACPHVDNMVGQALMSISSQVETTLHKKMPHCHSDVLSFWTLPPQHFHRSMTFRNISMDVTVKLPAGNSWSVFDRLSSEDRHKVLVGIQTEACNGLTVDDFSNNTLQIASLMKGIASEVPSLGVGLRAEVMSFAIIVDAIRDGVEKVMVLSTLPLGLAILMYMVGNARLVIIAVINVLGAVAGSVLVMNHIVIKLMPVSIFAPPFLIAVVLAMSIATLCVVLFICTAFTCSCFSSLRALFCLSWMLVILWAVSNWLFPQGLYFVVPPMMLPFLVGVALDYDIFYTEAVLEECKTGSCSAEKAGIDALGKTANTITAAGLIMILAFLPLLLSSATVLRQIGFIAIGGLFISAFWNTKVVMPLCVLLLKKYSFWPRNFEKKPAVDAIFLVHPAYLVDTFCLFSSPDAEKRWSPSWWMCLFLPFLWLIAFCSAHGLRRLGLPNYLVLDDFKYHGLRVQTWTVLHFGRHFRNSCELHDARRNVVAAVLAAEKTGARVLGLGALNKAQFLNRGGLDLLEELPTDRHMRITHGDHLTAAAVVETVKRLVAKLPGPGKPFLTGATSKTGKAVALALLQQGISVICHSRSAERREELESYGLETASKLRHGANSILWIVGKFDPRWCVQTFFSPPVR